MYLVAQFSLSPDYNVTVSAESVDGPTPTARVTWSTTVPPQCVSAMTVEFRTGSHSGPVVATNTTNNASQTEFIQTDLQCGTNYYIFVVVTVQLSDGSPTKSSKPVQVLVGGKKIVCMRFNWYSSLMVVMPLRRYTNSD